ncbi:MAG: NAD(P)/FAD-dependent oxidoreductase [Nitrososphaera sp.]|uniref:NAD(P)/FAD-dependent oxidoreductase n=1 Tax=Nitrososphaera sp. TaxID=1971748 RepID=UPI003D6F2913
MRIVILGAGFGGLAAASMLRGQLPPDHGIVVIDRKKEFMMGLVNLWILHGDRKLEDAQTPLAGLNAKGIEYLNDEVTAIDTGGKSVACKSHGKISYDYLIVALGSELAPERVAGFVGRGYNLYDAPQVPPLREKLLSMKKGKVAVCIMGMPYKCPPAPYEASLLIHDMLERNGTRKEIEIDVYAPAPVALPVAGPEVSREVVSILERNGINFHASHKLKTVSSALEFENGATQDCDVLVGIPQHRVPDVIKSSGLAAGDWMAVDRKTLRTNFESVFAIGDVTEIKVGQLAIPKAGIFAEAQAKVVAQQIADEINNRSPSAAFDGKGFCFMETGNGQAGYVDADFFAEPAPAVRLEPASRQNYEKKHDFERTRVRQWLL